MRPHGRARAAADFYRALDAQVADLKAQVKAHWEHEPCESRAGIGETDRRRYFEKIDAYRYEKAPFIPDFAWFDTGRGKRVLEVGLGSGSDFVRWVRSGARTSGRDLTEASVQLVRERLALERLEADVALGDVERLEFDDDTFDIVYSYGVIHHTSDTPGTVRQLHRVLRPGGTARVMIYHVGGLINVYQWPLFGPLKLKPWRGVRDVVYHHNESIGTKLYSRAEARELFSPFRTVHMRTVVSAGDTLEFQLSDKYKDVWAIRNAQRALGFLKHLRPFIPSSLGRFLFIEATK